MGNGEISSDNLKNGFYTKLELKYLKYSVPYQIVPLEGRLLSKQAAIAQCIVTLIF